MDPVALIRKHRAKGVLIDANLLVLFLVGTVNRRRILSFKRTKQYTPEDFDLLLRLLAWFGKVTVTPHILSQTSDLTDLPGEELFTIRKLLRTTVETYVEESYDPSKTLVSHPVFARLGLADAAIAAICARGTLVLTADRELQAVLEQSGKDALHFSLAQALASLF